jgi:ribulose-phosphate 3-epimerase
MTGSVLSLKRPAIAPSILTADFGRLHDQIQEAEQAGADAIHLDIMDGHFVPNISFGPLVVSTIKNSTHLPLDTHLMIEHPERYIDSFADAGASVLTVHPEATPHVHRAIQQIKARDIDAGVAVNPGTPLAAIVDLLPFVDLVLVMSVNPGFGGQSMIPSTLGKVSRLRSTLQERDLSNVRIEIDGGIKASNIAKAYEAGADIFVTGSSVFNDDHTVQRAIDELRSALQES